MPTSAQHKVLGKIPSIIYALIDPFSGKIRYVGKTTDSMQSRWSSHVRNSTQGGTHKNHWIQNCISKGQHPYIEQIDAGLWDLDTIDEREIYWIARLRQICDLTNSTTGGEGSPALNVSQETRDALSTVSRRNWDSPEYRENIAKKREEYWADNDRARAAVSAQTRVRWADPNYKARATFKSDEYRALRSEIATKNSNTPEGKKHLSEAGTKSIKLRRVCTECNYIGAPPHVGSHQKRTGHTGYKNLGVE